MCVCCVRDLAVKYQQRHMTVGTVYGLRLKDSETFYFKSPKLDLPCFPFLFRSNNKLNGSPANRLQLTANPASGAGGGTKIKIISIFAFLTLLL